jgi:hypothetical protein
LILAIIVLVLLGAPGGVIAFYNPLEHGNSGGTPGISVPYRDSHEPFGPRLRNVSYVHGASLKIDFSVRNEGPWGVTITEIPEQDFGFLDVSSVERGIRNRCCAETEPFAPFSLHAGEQRVIRLVGSIKGCGRWSGQGTATSTIDSLVIRFRLVGVPHTAKVVTQFPVAISLREGTACPESRAFP